MKHFILITTLAALGSLFMAGQALSTGEEHMGRSGSENSPAMTGERQMQDRVASQKLNQNQIREAQRLLNERGVKAGKADGILGKQTQKAIREFQEKENISVTGTLDEPTLRALAPDAEKQEFFGLSPAYGEQDDKSMENMPMTPDPAKDQPMEEQPREDLQKQEKTGY
jgi:peptidoglycan hydrolase-like protein with peptidoglycan-binding domain